LDVDTERKRAATMRVRLPYEGDVLMDAMPMVITCTLRQPIPHLQPVFCSLCRGETAEPFRNMQPIVCPTCKLKLEAGE
jgi:hypothetical protein